MLVIREAGHLSYQLFSIDPHLEKEINSLTKAE